MKVLSIITRLNVGGPALQVYTLAEGLAGRGYETVLVAGTCEHDAGDLPMALPPAQAVHTVPALSRSISPWRDLRALWSLYRFARRERPAIVHTHTAKAGVLGRAAAFLAGVPVIVHTYHGNSLSGYFSSRANALFRRVERMMARISDAILVVSPQQLDELSGRFRIAPRSRFRVVPLGMDVSAELSIPPPAPPENGLRVGWLGRMVPVKGVELLVAVAEETARRNLPVSFVVAGDGPERRLVDDAVARLGPHRLRWLGWQADVLPHLADCHLLIQTSRNEGTPVALIQGMAAARPFLSTAAGGVVDLVSGAVLRESAGCRWYANGVLAAPDAAVFAAALEEFRSDPSLVARMGVAARRFAAEHFAAERLAGDIEKLYAELLARKRRPAQGGC